MYCRVVLAVPLLVASGDLTQVQEVGVEGWSDLVIRIIVCVVIGFNYYYTGCLIVTEQKYWLITRARINFRGQTICHFFTDT